MSKYFMSCDGGGAGGGGESAEAEGMLGGEFANPAVAASLSQGAVGVGESAEAEAMLGGHFANPAVLGALSATPGQTSSGEGSFIPPAQAKEEKKVEVPEVVKEEKKEEKKKRRPTLLTQSEGLLTGSGIRKSLIGGR